MSEQQVSAQPDQFDVRVTADSHFAWLRTRLAIERTMMAYMRTAVALIGFGFAIVQFFVRFEELSGVAPAQHSAAPRYLGLALIGCGIVATVVSIWEYRRLVRYLWSGNFVKVAGVRTGSLPTPLYAVAIVLICVGMFAFFAVLLRLV